MIRHVCMFTLKEENKEKNIEAFLERAEDLRTLEMIKTFQVVRNVEKTPASNYVFDSTETLDAYQKSPEHVAFGEFVYTVRVDRACIDYEI